MFPHPDDGSRSEKDDFENQTGWENGFGSESEAHTGSEPQQPQPTALADMFPIPLLKGSLSASPGRVERLSASQLIGHGPEQQGDKDECDTKAASLSYGARSSPSESGELQQDNEPQREKQSLRMTTMTRELSRASAADSSRTRLLIPPPAESARA